MYLSCVVFWVPYEASRFFQMDSSGEKTQEVDFGKKTVAVGEPREQNQRRTKVFLVSTKNLSPNVFLLLYNFNNHINKYIYIYTYI